MLTILALASAGPAAAAGCDLNTGGTVAWSCAAGDDVTIGNNTTVTVDASKSAATLTVSSGSVLFSGGATLTISGATTVNPSGDLSGAGTLAANGPFDKQGAGSLGMSNAAKLAVNAQGSLSAGDICLTDPFGNDPLVQINGEFHIGPGASAAAFPCGANVDHAGIEIGQGATLYVDRPGATSIAVGIQSFGNLSLAPGQELDVAGRFDQVFPAETSVAAGAVFGGSGGRGVSGGSLSVNGLFGPALTLTGGVLRGSGHVSGYVQNVSGTVEPGDLGVGTLNVNRYTQSADGTLRVELGGTTPGSFDGLAVAGNNDAGGKIEAYLVNGFSPQLGDSFRFLTYGLAGFGSFKEATGAPLGLAFATQHAIQAVDLVTTLPAPVNTAAPTISGTAEIGQTLTCNPGSWTGGATLALEWLRNDNPIAGATGQSYGLTDDDEGLRIACRVTATNIGGSTQATTDAIRPGRPASPSEEPAPTPPAPPASAKTPSPATKKLGKRSVCAKVAGQRVCLTGPAALRSPACLLIKKATYKFTITASKKRVKVLSVKFRLDKKAARTRRKKPFTIKVAGLELKKGRHRVIADGRYVVKKKTRRKKLTLSFKMC